MVDCAIAPCFGRKMPARGAHIEKVVAQATMIDRNRLILCRWLLKFQFKIPSLVADSMKILFRSRFAVALLAGSFLGVATNAMGVTAEAELYRAPAKAPVEAPRIAAKLPVGLSIELPELALPRAAAATAAGPIGPQRIGVGRDLPANLGKVLDTSKLRWVSDGNGGLATLVSIRSKAARGLRLGVQVFQMPDTANLRFYALGQSRLEGTRISGAEINASLARDKAVRDPDDPNPLVYWSPLVDGEALALEIHLPKGLKTADLEIALLRVSHLYAGALDSPYAGIGDAASCTIDYTCRRGVWGDVGPAVARMIFTLSDGSTSLCTGSLISDMNPDHQLPYFLTAGHCISEQNVASTLQTYWFFRSRVCDGLPSSDVQVRSGGAVLLKHVEETDATLLRLNDTPPDGVILAGWDTVPVPTNYVVGGISHPAGDLKKVSVGVTKTYGSCYLPPNLDSGAIYCSAVYNGNYVRVYYSYGMVEGGSSGSPLFKRDTKKIVGTLTGGSDSCGNVNGEIYYGRFELSYAKGFEQWLSATADTDCNARPGSWAYCSNPACGPCGEGEGDCDTNQDCGNGLVCTEDVGADYGFSASTDVCLAATDAPPPAGCRLSPGHWDYCADPNCGPCQDTEGDCDSNSECGNGLVCLQDTGEAQGFAPTVDVCGVLPAGSCPLTNGDWDYCSDPYCGPCASGQGDCDSNADCADGLICALDVGADYGLEASTDVCVTPTPDACQKQVGDWGFCSDPACGPCTEGQGDCDTKQECATGLQCSFNAGEQFGLPANMDVCTAP